MNLNLQTQVCMNSFSLFSINYLNIDSQSASHQGGRKFDPSHSESFLPLASRQDSRLWDSSVTLWYWVPSLPSQRGPLRSAACSYPSHTQVWDPWWGLKPDPRIQPAWCSLWLTPLRVCCAPTASHIREQRQASSANTTHIPLMFCPQEWREPLLFSSNSPWWTFSALLSSMD